METIICAAIQLPDGRVIRGHRHADCIHTMERMRIETRHTASQEGFVTSLNRFVGRKEGCGIQIRAGIPSILPLHDAYLNGELYSEDLY